MAYDSSNEEVLKAAESSSKEFDEAMVCEGVSVVDNSNQFVVEFKGGRMLIVGPHKQTLTKNELCKLKDMKGLNYEQSIVSKRESMADITQDKRREDPLFTVSEIVAKHTDVWMDEYENEKSGFHELICGDIKLDIVRLNQGIDKTILSTSGNNVVQLNLTVDNLFSSVPAVIFYGTTDFAIGTLSVLVGGVKALPYVPI